MNGRPESVSAATVERGSVVGSSGSLPRIAGRLALRRADVAMAQRAAAEIEMLGADLDRRLQGETRPAERLRMTRETTNQITRLANDAISAYARASRAVRAEQDRSGFDHGPAHEMRERLDEARVAILGALEVANRRYPPKDLDTG